MTKQNSPIEQTTTAPSCQGCREKLGLRDSTHPATPAQGKPDNPKHELICTAPGSNPNH